jgi:uncharacterized integral membrane protein
MTRGSEGSRRRFDRTLLARLVVALVLLVVFVVFVVQNRDPVRTQLFTLVVSAPLSIMLVIVAVVAAAALVHDERGGKIRVTIASRSRSAHLSHELLFTRTRDARFDECAAR